jgi:hypothetical protein
MFFCVNHFFFFVYHRGLVRGTYPFAEILFFYYSYLPAHLPLRSHCLAVVAVNISIKFFEIIIMAKSAVRHEMPHRSVNFFSSLFIHAILRILFIFYFYFRWLCRQHEDLCSPQRPSTQMAPTFPWIPYRA